MNIASAAIEIILIVPFSFAAWKITAGRCFCSRYVNGREWKLQKIIPIPTRDLNWSDATLRYNRLLLGVGCILPLEINRPLKTKADIHRPAYENIDGKSSSLFVTRNTKIQRSEYQFIFTYWHESLSLFFGPVSRKCRM